VMDKIKDKGTGDSVHGHKFKFLKFADYMDLLEEDRDEQLKNLKLINEAGEAVGLKINLIKNHDYEVWTKTS